MNKKSKKTNENPRCPENESSKNNSGLQTLSQILPILDDFDSSLWYFLVNVVMTLHLSLRTN